MSDLLVYKPKKEPSFINREMMLGMSIGALFVPGAPIVGGAIAAVGALIGALMGKSREEHEKQDGKAVGDPTVWSKETFTGGLLGFIGGGIVNRIVQSALVGVVSGGAGAAVGLAVGISTLIAATYTGNKIGKARQAGEYEEAKKQTIVNHLSKTVSPEVGKAVEYSLENNKEWGKEVSEERLLAAAQGRTP